jgi:lactoylglutathione lyase
MNTGHVGLNVRDLDKSIEFYTKVFDLSLSGRGDDTGKKFAFLADNGRLAITLWQQSERTFDGTRAGLHHLAFLVPSVEAVKSAQEKLRAMNTPFEYEGIVPHKSGAESGGIYFTDPDGVRLEIYTEHGVHGEAPHSDAPTCGFF